MNSVRKAVFASLGVVGIGAVALPAAAIGFQPVLVGITTTEIDDVTINTDGVDLAASGLPAGAALTPAEVHWEQSSSNATSKLTGSFYLNNISQTCAKVQLVSYDENGSEIGRVADRPESIQKCAGNNNYFEQIITDQYTFTPYLQGQPGAAEVKVRLLTAANVDPATQVWGQVGVAKLLSYGPVLGTSEVLISAPKFDLGTGPRAGGTYTDPATVTWSVDGANLIKVNTVGTLSLETAANLCGRIRYTYLNKSDFAGFPDTVLGTQYRNTHCANDIPPPGIPNSLQEFVIPLSLATPAYAALDKVEIAIEKSSFNQQTHVSNEDWVVVGSPVNVFLPSAP